MKYPRYADRCRNFESDKKLICYLCPELLNNEERKIWQEHVQDPEHLLILQSFRKSFKETKFSATCKHCSKTFSKHKTMTHAIEHQLLPWYKPEDLCSLFFENYIAQIETQYYCHVCRKKLLFWHVALDHTHHSDHQHLQKDKMCPNISNALTIHISQCELLIKHSIFLRRTEIFECMICKCQFSGCKNIDEHVNGRYHKFHEKIFLSEFFSKEERNERITHKTTSSKTHERRHWRSAAFVKKPEISLKSFSNMENSKVIESRPINSTDKIISSKGNISQSKPQNNKDMNFRRAKRMQNKSNSLHLQLTKITQGVLKTNMPKYPCRICGEKIQSSVDLHSHYTNHVWMRFVKNPNTEDENLLNVTSDFNNKCSVVEMNKNQLENGCSNDLDPAPAELNDLVERFETTLDLSNISIDDETNKSLVRKSPEKKSERHPKVADIADDRIASENIYQIDSEQLKNIEYGIWSSAVIQENNIYCIICRKTVLCAIHIPNLYEHLFSNKHINYLKEMKNDHLRFETFSNTWSDLQLALQFIQDISDKYVKCWACNENIMNAIDNLTQHVETRIHKNKCDALREHSRYMFKFIKMRMFRDWYNTQYYWCVLCDNIFTVENDFVSHLHKSQAHKENCSKYEGFEKLMFNYCLTCATLWYGFECTYAYHCKCKMHKYGLKDKFYDITQLPEKVKKLLHSANKICDELLAEIVSNMQSNRLEEESLLKDLKEAVQDKFNQVKLYPFGSRMTNLGFKDSDFDIFVDCSRVYDNSHLSPGKNSESALLSVEKSLIQRPDIWKINRTITKNVRVPIIKACHRPTGIECDFSFTSGISVENSKLIKNYIKMYPPCQKLILFLKKWAVECNLTGQGGFISYGITWLVLYYLQSEKILPSVLKLIQIRGESNIVGGCETGVAEDYKIVDVQQNFIELLKKFFLTYSQFDYRHEIVCPFLGAPLNKVDVAKGIYPIEMKPYINQIISNTCETIKMISPISIQDPYRLYDNLSVNVEKFIVHRFKSFCLLSAELLIDQS